MARRFYKFRLLLDEGLPHRRQFHILNSRFNVKHIVGDFKSSGLEDPEVYKRAISENRLLVTLNERDFRKLVRKNSLGIIGISGNMTTAHIDKKLNALLTKSKPKDLFGRFTSISGES